MIRSKHDITQRPSFELQGRQPAASRLLPLTSPTPTYPTYPPAATFPSAAMPRLDDSTEALLESGERRAKRVWEDFTEFALRDNVLEVAVGLMYANSLL